MIRSLLDLSHLRDNMSKQSFLDLTLYAAVVFKLKQLCISCLTSRTTYMKEEPFWTTSNPWYWWYFSRWLFRCSYSQYDNRLYNIYKKNFMILYLRFTRNNKVFLEINLKSLFCWKQILYVFWCITLNYFFVVPCRIICKIPGEALQ